jgi:membrane protein CcdC involved in cytochrome C biogenesis
MTLIALLLRGNVNPGPLAGIFWLLVWGVVLYGYIQDKLAERKRRKEREEWARSRALWERTKGKKEPPTKQ